MIGTLVCTFLVIGAKHYHPERVAVKVEGGYKTMTHDEYRIWRNQK